MRKSFLLVLLLATAAHNAAAQSGRRITATRPTLTAPVQPPANPEPEIRTDPITPAALHSLPHGLRARQIEALDRGSFRFADFQGKVLVINLWASWCGPCRREVPEYEKVRKEYQGRQVEFIGLTTEDPYTSAGRVKKFIRDTNFTFLIGWADQEIARSLMVGGNAIPQTLVVDAEGRVVAHWRGYARGRSGDRLKQAIDSALMTH